MYDKQIYEPVVRPLDDYYAQIAERTKWDKDNPPYIVFGLGTARTGTTASLNVFRGSMVEDKEGSTYQIPVAYQHFKAGLRHAMLGWKENEDWEFEIPKTPLFYMKDTIGPYTEKESEYNPQKIFEYMGYPADRIVTVFYYRDPLDILSSWIDKWNDVVPREVLAPHFITASKTLAEIKDENEVRNSKHTTFLYECIRDNPPFEAASALFRKINNLVDDVRIIPTETTTENWDRVDRMGWKPNQPKIYEIPKIDDNVHRDARTKTSWDFRKKSPRELASLLLPSEVDQLESAGLQDIYDRFRSDSRHSLGLEVGELGSFAKVKEAFIGGRIERR